MDRESTGADENDTAQKKLILRLIAVIAAAVLLVAAVLFFPLTGWPNDQVWHGGDPFSLQAIQTVEKTGEDFRILLFTDTQLWSNLLDNKRCYEQMDELVQRTAPNLIVLPGDNLSAFASRFSIANFIRHMDAYGVPWAPVDVKSGAQFFFPFHLRLGSVLFDYILAHPIAKRTEGNKTVCYFAACEGVAPKCAVGGRENLLSFGHSGNEFGDVVIVLLTMAQAKTFYLLGGQVYFSDTGIYESNGTIVREHQTELPLSLFSLRRIKPRRLPLNYFLYSRGRRAYYELRLPENILQSHRDIVLEFTFDGLNLQVFSGKTLINDFFNIDRRFVLHLRDWRAYWQKDPVLILRTAPLTRCGVSHVYHEVPIPLYSNALTLKRAYAIDVKEEAHAAIGFDDSAE